MGWLETHTVLKSNPSIIVEKSILRLVLFQDLPYLDPFQLYSCSYNCSGFWNVLDISLIVIQIFPCTLMSFHLSSYCEG